MANNVKHTKKVIKTAGQCFKCHCHNNVNKISTLKKSKGKHGKSSHIHQNLLYSSKMQNQRSIFYFLTIPNLVERNGRINEQRAVECVSYPYSTRTGKRKKENCGVFDKSVIKTINEAYKHEMVDKKYKHYIACVTPCNGPEQNSK